MTKLFFASVFCVVFLFPFFIFGQATPTPTPEQEDEEIIRISSELVLVDALVLDKKGNQVKDLTPEDFEVYQDGKLQKITNFTYVDGKSQTLVATTKKRDKKAIPPPPFSPRSNLGRIITFVVDDGNCLARAASLSNARQGLRKFIDEKMLPSDKVAIYRTRGGSSLLQAYTSNKEALKRVVKKIRWYPTRCTSAFDAARDTSTIKVTGSGADNFETEESKAFKRDISENERINLVKGTFGVLDVVIDRLKVLPQRKVVFFISDGIYLDAADLRNNETISVLREITDKASRSSVVFYTMSGKGLTNPGFISAEDEVLPGISSGTDNTSILRSSRREEERSLNSGLGYLAYQTGGDFIRNKTFLSPQIEKVLEKETGYYLLGYEPESDTFKGKKFHKINVKLKRDDLEISSRGGFIGKEDEKIKTRYKSTNSPLYQAIASPFQENTLDIQLTTLTGNTAKKENYIRAMFHIKGEDLTFIDEPNGMKKVVIDVVAVALNEKGKVAKEINYTYPIRIPRRGIEIVRKNGLDYSTDVILKKPGFYNFRLAVRDENSKRLGSAGDFVKIPNPKKKDFFINGLLTTSLTNKGKAFIPKSRSIDAAFAPVFTTSVPSVRQYKAGVPFAYIYNIHHAKINSKTRKPNLTTRFRIYKDGKLLTESKETPVDLEPQANMSRIQDYGLMNLRENAEVGEYVLQLIIKDVLAKKVSSEWIDFEIIH